MPPCRRRNWAASSTRPSTSPCAPACTAPRTSTAPWGRSPKAPSASARGRSAPRRTWTTSPARWRRSPPDAAGRAVSPYRLTHTGRVKALTASQDNTNDPELFVIGLDNQVYTLAFNADGSVFSGTPNYTLTAPGRVQSIAAAQPGPLQNPELFAVRPDNQVYEALAPSAVGKYGPYQVQVPGKVKALSVTPDSAGDLHLFVIGLDSQVYQALFDGRGSAMSPYRLTAPGQVKAIATGQSALSHPLLFAIGLDSQVATLGFNDDGTLLKETPHYVLTTPGQVRAIVLGRANGRAAVFAVGLDGQVYESVSASFPAYQPYRLAAPGWIK